ncbi:MAG: hypothetical protein WBE73_19640, partial [Candidatus Acidiferrum sp.]
MAQLFVVQGHIAVDATILDDRGGCSGHGHSCPCPPPMLMDKCRASFGQTPTNCARHLQDARMLSVY